MKKILILVSGMSPQIVTETLYALHRQTPSWVPDEIRLVTTKTGKQRAELELLKGSCHFQRWREDYEICQPIHFDSNCITVIHDKQGNPLQDLRSPEDNESAADLIAATVQEFTQSPDTEVHVSLAGGRKTMGYYAGYALSIFGREQDSLSHVLVSEGFESLPDFYYPTPYDQVIRDRKGQPLNAADARVWLAEIPFVRMRGLLKGCRILHQYPFSDIVARLNAVTSDAKIQLELTKSQLIINNIAIDIEPRAMALYWVLARRLQKGQKRVRLARNIADQDLAQEYLACYRQLKGDMADIDKSEQALAKGMDLDYLRPIRSRLKKSLQGEIGDQGAEMYQIQAGGKNTGEIYLALKPEQIEIVQGT